MAGNVQNITNFLVNGEVYAYCDVPSANTAPTLTTGIPAGAKTLYLGATQGEMVSIYTPTIAGVAIEQVYGDVAQHLTAEVAQMRMTLVEPNLRNLEMVASQATRVNLLDNASFERAGTGGLADQWAGVGTITSPSLAADPQSAYGAIGQRFTTGGAAGGIQSAKLTHPALVAGAIAVFSAYTHVAASTPNGTFKLEAFDSSGTTLGSNTAVVAQSTAYARGSVAYTLPANTATVQATVQDATGQSATWTVDNAQLEIVASGSTPTAVVAPAALFFGGRTDTLTYAVAIVGQKPGTSKYFGAMLYSAYVTGGLPIRKNRVNPTTLQITFTGIPVTTRPAGDNLMQFFEQQ